MVDESESHGQPDRMLSIQSLRYGTCPDSAGADRRGNDCRHTDRRNLVFYGSGRDVYGLHLTSVVIERRTFLLCENAELSQLKERLAVPPTSRRRRVTTDSARLAATPLPWLGRSFGRRASMRS